jgi:hypothetical protein
MKMFSDHKVMQDKNPLSLTADVFKKAQDNVTEITKQMESGALDPEMAEDPGVEAVPGLGQDFKMPQPKMDIAQKLDVLPGGQEVKMIGDVEGLKEFNHKQGDNDLGYKGTCGLCSCEDVLKQCGQDVTENDMVKHASENGLCETNGPPEQCGGTTVLDQTQVLQDHGVAAHPEVMNVDALADQVEQGKGIIVEANAGVLWNDANYFEQGDANHAVVVTGVARDSQTNAVAGFYINDSGTGDAGKFVDKATMSQAWEQTGGLTVVTDTPTSSYLRTS